VGGPTSRWLPEPRLRKHRPIGAPRNSTAPPAIQYQTRTPPLLGVLPPSASYTTPLAVVVLACGPALRFHRRRPTCEANSQTGAVGELATVFRLVQLLKLQFLY
jgi:hypothetical protein